jgi:hypothetical protein
MTAIRDRIGVFYPKKTDKKTKVDREGTCHDNN